MKALSLRQPWADLVMQGKKTLELRTWSVSYRGPLVIHASQTVDEQACRAHDLDPDSMTIGALIGMVDVLNIVRLDEQAFQARQADHLGSGYFKLPREGETLFGWELGNPRELSRPVPFRGRMNLFNVPDELLDIESQKIADPLSPPVQGLSSKDWDTRQTFELRLIPEQSKAISQPAYRLALHQRIVEPPPAQGRLTSAASVRMHLVADLGGNLLRAVADQILEALRQNEYQATDLSPARREPFLLAEESGVRLGLLFLAIRPIAKISRVEAISGGIRAMTGEELYYWFSKCVAPDGAGARAAVRAQKALRILLSNE